jgi:hypothetical protein
VFVRLHPQPVTPADVQTPQEVYAELQGELGYKLGRGVMGISVYACIVRRCTALPIMHSNGHTAASIYCYATFKEPLDTLHDEICK